MNEKQRAAALRLADYWSADAWPGGLSGTKMDKTAALLREIASEPQAEPACWGWRVKDGRITMIFSERKDNPDLEVVPLFTHPPQQRKPLTKVQITELAEQCGYDGAVPTVRLAFQGFKLDDFARAIERMHGIKETP